jgi:hypothetical protein
MEIELSCQREVLTAQPLKSEAVLTSDLSSGPGERRFRKGEPPRRMREELPSRVDLTIGRWLASNL